MTASETPINVPAVKKFNPMILLWLIGLGGLIIGSIGLFQRFEYGLRLTNLGSYIPWGLWVAAYEYFVWLEAGSLLVFTLLVYVFKWNGVLPKMARLLYLSALAILGMALILIGLDLGHPFRFWHVLVSPQWGSLMTWMIWLHVIYMAILVTKLAIEVYGRSTLVKKVGTVLAYASLPLGLALVVVAGSVFGVVIGRPAWHGSMLPLFFLLSALVAGLGLLTFQFIWFWQGKRDEEGYLSTSRFLGNLLLGGLIIVFVAEMLIGLVTLFPGVPAQVEALRLTLFGPYWWVFWVFHIGMGVILPILILVTKTRTARRIGVAAGILILTFISVPLNIVIPPQLVVEIIEKSLVTAFTGHGLSATYFPSMSEWLVVLFAVAFGYLVFLAGYQLFGMRPSDKEIVHSVSEE